MAKIYTKFEEIPSIRLWDITFTSVVHQRTDLHMAEQTTRKLASGYGCCRYNWWKRLKEWIR